MAAPPRPTALRLVRIADDPRCAPPPTSLTPAKPKRLVVATDGGYSKRHGGGSFGWITADGRFGWGSVEATSALHAELVAVDNALRAQEVGTRILLLVDSTKAIDAVRALIARPKKCVEKGGRIEARLYSISNALSYRDVELRWVRGHTDHPLNDAADRLARLGRQTHMYETDTRTANRIARQIAMSAAAEFASAC